MSAGNLFQWWSHPVSAAPSTLALTAIEDTYTDPRFPSANFGGYSYLNYSVTNSSQTYVWLKFDISGLPPSSQVLNVTMSLYLLGASSSFPGYQPKTDGQVGAFNASNAWSELTLTNNTAPGVSKNSTDVKVVGVPGTYSWNVTKIIKPMIGKSSRATIVLHHNGTLPKTPPYPLLLFQSKDANTPPLPTLTVLYRKNPSAISTFLEPSRTIFGSPVIINATLRINGTRPAFQTGTTAIQFSIDNLTWSNIVAGPPGTNGTNIALWFPPVATSYYIRSTWSGDLLTQSSISPVQLLTVAKATTTTSILLSASTISYANQILVIATLRPQLSEGIMRVEYSTDYGANWAELFSLVPVNGFAFQSFPPSMTGNYLFRATWLGDANYNASSSAPVSLTVTTAPTSLTLSVSQVALGIGSSVVVSGFLRASGGTAISGGKVTIQAGLVSSQPIVFANLTSISTGIDGSFLFPWVPQTNGTYLVRAYFPGTNNYELSISRTQQVLVGLQVFPTASEIGLISGFIGFFIGLGVSFLVRFRRQVTVKRRQRYGGAKTRGEQTPR